MLQNLYAYLNKIFWRIVSDQYQVNDHYPLSKISNFDRKRYINQLSVAYYKILRDNSCLIEPQTGWAIQGRTIIAESYAFWTNVKSGWPPLPSLINYLNPFKKTKRTDKAVSFHYGWNNYYHFFIDTLPQIKYWQSLNRQDIPWIVPAEIKNIPFVQEYLDIDPFLKDQKVIYQSSNEYIQIKNEAHFIKRSRFGSIELKSVIELLIENIEIDNSLENKKIFLIRKEHRCASNIEELITIAQSYDFEPIYTDNMSLKDQINVFRCTRWLIGFHGAGLTNMIFRKGHSMSVLEIFPKNKIPLHYWHLTLDFDFKYSYLIGESYNSKNEQFYLSPDQFDTSINVMLNEDPSLSL